MAAPMSSQAGTSAALHDGMPDDQLEDLVQDAVVWATQHGLVVGAGTDPAAAVVHAPVSCLPVAFPKDRFLQAKAATQAFNRVIDAVAADEPYLRSILAAAASADAFTAGLLQVLVQSEAARKALAVAGKPELALGIHRSDYMLDAPSGGFLQVELNTVASSFGCLSSLATEMHGYVSSRASGSLEAPRIPPNNAIDKIPQALAAACQAHGAAGGVVLMVVQPGERNAYDQQWLQLRLWQEHGIKTIRRSLAELAVQASISPDGKLSVGASPVSVVYFRAGYTPDDYSGGPDGPEWAARLLLESSDAAKCPTAAYQLAGAKKVQQDLAQPGVLERYCGSEQEARELRTFFAGLWGLDDLAEPATAAAVAQAIADPEGFVLKPQREGGGNNLYGTALAEKLQQGTGLSAFILMQKILPPPQQSVLIRSGAHRVVDTVSELGIYGTFLRRGDEVLLNEEAGHLVRTKQLDSDEGGVNAGFAVLDSPYLLD